jgi:hypothetical protein
MGSWTSFVFGLYGLGDCPFVRASVGEVGCLDGVVGVTAKAGEAGCSSEGEAGGEGVLRLMTCGLGGSSSK